MNHIWVCHGCFASVGIKPESVTDTCDAGTGFTCAVCNDTQNDRGWFKHVFPEDLPEKLRERLVIK